MNPVPPLEQIFLNCDKDNSLNIESTEWSSCFTSLCWEACGGAGTSAGNCQACEAKPMEVFECFDANESSGINNNEFTAIAEAISSGSFDSTM